MSGRPPLTYGAFTASIEEKRAPDSAVASEPAARTLATPESQCFGPAHEPAGSSPGKAARCDPNQNRIEITVTVAKPKGPAFDARTIRSVLVATPPP
jgi:hypothetical protein